MSPTLSKLSNAFENFSIEALGKVVSQLVSGRNLEHFDISVANVVPKEVPLNQEVLGAISNALLGSEQQSTVVVFKTQQRMVDLKSGGRVNSLQISPRRSQSGNRVLMLALRAEYSDSNVDREISVWS